MQEPEALPADVTQRIPLGRRPPESLFAGRYDLLEPLGSGGMAVVWRAEDAVLGRHVAVKRPSSPVVAAS